MSLDIKQKTKKTIWIIGCVIAYMALQLTVMLLERRGFNAYNGVFMAFQYGICLLMVMKENRRNMIRFAMLLMSITLLMLLRAVLFLHYMQGLPGLCNILFYMLTMLMLSTNYKRREKESITDILTGAMNRRGLYKQLQEQIENEQAFHVVYLSLDNFKFINDNYGHAYGDALLGELTERVQGLLGEDVQIARIGGAEFVLLIDGKRNAQQTADAVLDLVREKAALVVDGTRVDCYMSCYAGIASYPDHAGDYESLIKNADIAMYEAISAKSKTAYCFDDDMAKYMNRQIELERLIKDGLRKDYFYLVYQPQYHLEGKRLRGFEALLRMKTPDGQIVSPGEFIPVAEKGELILQIDEYVLKRAMQEFKEIIEKNPELMLSVNVSAKNVGNADFVDKLTGIMEKLSFSPDNLEVEITEYCLMESMDIAINNIKRLHALGVHIAVDDFGTGYTSLNYLAKLPVNLLKVDKSLVDDIQKDAKSREFVQAVISMGHLMGCQVISEGVEDEWQLQILREDNCDMVQGFVWGKPLDYQDVRKMVC